MEPLKELFNREFYERLAGELQNADKAFNARLFLSQVTDNMQELSLNQRMRRTSVVLKEHLPASYPAALEILKRTIPNTRPGYTNLLFPDFVGLYGHNDFEASMDALAYFTRFGSSEFAIREFLKRDFKRTITIMNAWADDQDVHVRRLASEGSRPRLPWSFKLDAVINDPSLTQSILEKLREDPELYVRKSVANHLNDISKEHPDYMLKLIGRWDKKNTATAWIIKHASRTLIKKGHAGSLAVFDFEKNAKLRIGKFKLSSAQLRLGDTLQFEFEVISEKNREQKLVIDYLVHYRKKSGGLSPKVFKLQEINLKPGETARITKKQVFRNFTTRTHFAGTHLLEIQVNGRILGQKKFSLSIQ